MTDRMETLNTVNAASKSLKVRVQMPFDRATNGKLHIFGCYFVSETGAYMLGEALIFGDTPQKRAPALQALQKKWTENSAWNLSKMKAKTKNDQYHSAPHMAVLDLNAKGFVATKLNAEDAKQLPGEVEPKLLPEQVRTLSKSQCIDTVGVCTTSPIVRIRKARSSSCSQYALLTEVNSH